MRKKSCKFLSVALALCLTVGMTACGGDKKTNSNTGTTATPTPSSGNKADSTTEKPAVDHSEFVTLDVFNYATNYVGKQTGWFADHIKEKFNIELNIIGADSYQTRAAAGFLGDIVSLNKPEMLDCIDAGVMLDITDRYNNSTYLKDFDLAIQYYKDSIGKDAIYAIPGQISYQSPTTLDIGANPPQGSFIRLDYYNELGKPEINGMDGLLDVLKQMQDAHPTTEDGKKVYGFSLFGDWDGSYMSNASKFAFLYGYNENVAGYCFPNADCSSYTHVAEDGGVYYQALELLFKANQMGLVDPDSTTQVWDNVYAKMQNGQTLFAVWPWLGSAYNSLENQEAGKGMAYVPIKGCKVLVNGPTTFGTNIVMGVGSESKHPDRAFEFLDYLASAEFTYASDHTKAGLKGDTWDIINGRPDLTEKGIPMFRDNTLGDGCASLNLMTIRALDKDPETGEGYAVDGWDSTIERNANAFTHLYEDVFGVKDAGELLEKTGDYVVAPSTGYTAPLESTDIKSARTQSGDVIRQASWQMVFAKDKAEFDAIWEDMQTKIEGFGYQDVLEFDSKIVEGLHAAMQEVESAAAGK